MATSDLSHPIKDVTISVTCHIQLKTLQSVWHDFWRNFTTLAKLLQIFFFFWGGVSIFCSWQNFDPNWAIFMLLGKFLLKIKPSVHTGHTTFHALSNKLTTCTYLTTTDAVNVMLWLFVARIVYTATKLSHFCVKLVHLVNGLWYTLMGDWASLMQHLVRTVLTCENLLG